MRYLIVVLLTLLVAAPFGTIAASAQTPAGQPAEPGGHTLDLAAMTLAPGELAALGLPGFGLANQSSLRDPETDAVVEAEGDDLDAGERLAADLRDGLLRRYVGSLLRPRTPLERLPSGLLRADARVSTSVAEYATDDGAEAGFADAVARQDASANGDLPDPPAIGDQTAIALSSAAETETGEPFQRLELVFRSGALLGEVAITDYTNAAPDAATAARLAEELAAKMDRVRAEGGPDLGSRALRISPMSDWILAGRLRDFYVRYDGVDRPTFAELTSAIESGIPAAAFEPGPEPGAAIDTYMFWTPLGHGDPLDLPLYVVRLSRFASAEEAAADLAGQTADFGNGYVDVTEMPRATIVGDESRAFSYGFDDEASGTVVRGHVVMARVGDVVVNLQVDSPDGVSLDGVEALAAAQADCLRSTDACEPVPALLAIARLVGGE